MSAANDVYCGPSRGSRGGDSGLGIFAEEPLLTATGDAERSRLEGGLDAEAEGLLGDLLGSFFFFSTHSAGEGVLLDFLVFFAFLGFGGGDFEGSRLLFLFGRGDSLDRLCLLLGEGDVLDFLGGL